MMSYFNINDDCQGKTSILLPVFAKLPHLRSHLANLAPLWPLTSLYHYDFQGTSFNRMRILYSQILDYGGLTSYLIVLPTTDEPNGTG